MSGMKKKPSSVPPSEDFERAFADCVSGCKRLCACGRIVFDGANNWDWDDGELEGLRRSANAAPNEFVEVDYSVQTMTIEGRELVMGCPCNGAREYQDFIDGHARQIAHYLNCRAKALREKADQVEVTTSLIYRGMK